jgi:hypothetical protein
VATQTPPILILQALVLVWCQLIKQRLSRGFLIYVGDVPFLAFKITGRGIAGYYKALSFVFPAFCFMLSGDSFVQSMVGIGVFIFICSRVGFVGLCVKEVVSSVKVGASCVSKALVCTKIRILRAVFGPKSRGAPCRSSSRRYKRYRRRRMHVHLVRSWYYNPQ